MDLGPIGKSPSIVRLELYRLIEILERLFVVSFFQVSEAAIVERPRKIRIEINRLIVVVDRGVEIPLRHIGVAPVVVGDRPN